MAQKKNLRSETIHLASPDGYVQAYPPTVLSILIEIQSFVRSIQYKNENRNKELNLVHR